jgi:hypothetical protein
VSQSVICPPTLAQTLPSGASFSAETAAIAAPDDDENHDDGDRSEQTPPETSAASARPAGPQVELHFVVHSTGMTIDKEEYVQLFKPFGQSDLPNSRKFGAAGLGKAPLSLAVHPQRHLLFYVAVLSPSLHVCVVVSSMCRFVHM